MPTHTKLSPPHLVMAWIYNTHMYLLRLWSSVCECTRLWSGSRALSWATFHRNQPIGSPKVNMALATRLNPLQPLLSASPLPLFNYLSLSGWLAELYVGQRWVSTLHLGSTMWNEADCRVISRVCVCVCAMLACVYVCLIPSLRDTRAVWSGKNRVVQPEIWHFKLVAARGELCSNFNAHWGRVSACMMTQHTCLFPQTGDGVVNRHWRPINFLICWEKNAANEKDKCHFVMTDKRRVSVPWRSQSSRREKKNVLSKTDTGALTVLGALAEDEWWRGG